MRFAFVPVVLSAALLAGCAGTDAASNFTMPSFPGFFQAGQSLVPGTATGLAVLGVRVEGLDCAETRLTLARQEGDSLVAVKEVVVDSGFGRGEEVAVVELPAGAYHLVRYICRNGRNVTHVGGSTVAGEVPWRNDRWQASLARIEITAATVADAGQLTIVPRRVQGFAPAPSQRQARLEAGPLSEAARAGLLERRAEIGREMRPRLMQLVAGGEVALRKCTLVNEQPLKADPEREVPKELDNPLAGAALSQLAGSSGDATGCREQGGGGLLGGLGQ